MMCDCFPSNSTTEFLKNSLNFWHNDAKVHPAIHFRNPEKDKRMDDAKVRLPKFSNYKGFKQCSGNVALPVKNKEPRLLFPDI